MSNDTSSATPKKIVANNRKARHQYHILETLQAGIALKGTEVKSIREGRVNLNESFAAINEGEAYLMDCHISPYSHGNINNHEPTRPKKLLLHKREIIKLFGKLQTKGLTMIPLRMYFERGKVKVDIAMARGKKLHDKREDMKKRDLEREMQAAKKYR